MTPSILWYQCIHPQFPNKYFFSPKSLTAKWHLTPEDMSHDTVQYLYSLGFFNPKSIIYYIS